MKTQTELLRQIINNIPSCVFWKDLNSVYLGCNDQFAQTAGFPDPSHVVGKTDFDMPWTLQESKNYRYCDAQLIATQKPIFDLEETQQDFQGRDHTVLTSKVPLRHENGEIFGILGIYTDITQRKRADDTLRTRLAAIDASADMVIICDRDGIIEYVNPAFTTTTGYTAQEVIGQNPRAMKSGVHDPQFYAILWQTILDGKVWRGELTNRRKDGTYYPEEMTITPVHNNAGKVIRFVAIKRDITMRKQTETIEHVDAMLRESIKSMEQVLGIVGHELRTPLAGIRAIAETLQIEGVRESVEYDSLIKNLHDVSLRMTNIVDRLLEAARLNSGRANWNWETVHLKQIVHEAIETVRPLIDTKKVGLFSFLTPEDVVMQGDADALRRLIVNLLTNSQKNTHSGEIQVIVMEARENQQQWIELAIRDTGKGIAPHLARKLGEAFALNSGIVGTNQVDGAGLGLAICKGIAAAHGGEIHMVSTDGHGTTVTAKLRADLMEPAKGQGKIDYIDASQD